MRILVVGAGGVGAAVAAIARRRGFFERLVLTDLDAGRAEAAAARAGDERVSGVGCDASDTDALVALIEAQGITHVLNACDPRLNPPIFAAAGRGGVTYLDMAMTLSERHPQEPFAKPGVMLGDAQFAEHEAWEQDGRLALVGIGVEPGASDVFARHAADTMFETIDEIGVRDGADLVVQGYAFAPTFSIWTTIEECLNPPLIWERDRGFYVTEPFSEPEIFEFPEGIGPVECVNVEHEEVVLIPRWVDCNRVTFKYGLGAEFIGVLRTLHLLGLDATEPLDVRGQQVSPRDVVAAALPDPAGLGDRMTGRTCAGTLVTGTGKDGAPRATYLYHLVDNERTMREDGCQAVVWQTAINPVIALELLESGAWSGVGVLGPEAFPSQPFLDLLAEYGAPHGVQERDVDEPQRAG
ncbi:saccharopine dehydrogenase family protein [Paraconexibacter sp.]|uniref:saccharopine dehydrogenase family protein n=1 Tax=Paraconexibacter sp. TaxID=2949640 RepID=UPI003561F4D6